jgi:hypothetical protein
MGEGSGKRANPNVRKATQLIECGQGGPLSPTDIENLPAATKGTRPEGPAPALLLLVFVAPANR